MPISYALSYSSYGWKNEPDKVYHIPFLRWQCFKRCRWCVRLNDELLLGVWEFQYWCVTELHLQLVESLLHAVIPTEVCIPRRGMVECGGYLHIVLDESLLIVWKPQKSSLRGLVKWRESISYRYYFFQVRSHTTRAQYMAKDLHLVLGQLTLGYHQL